MILGKAEQSHSMARILAGSWRSATTHRVPGSDELTNLLPYLLASGTAPLAWWHIRHTPLRHTPAAQELQDAYRETSAFGLAREPTIETIFVLLRGAGIEPILLKGWAIARLYPEPGLRPLGDIDLYVAPGEEYRVEAALQTPGRGPFEVDLTHDLSGLLQGRSMTEVAARSELVPLGTSEIRVLNAEDQLAYLCIHFLKHGGWRPLWLCDVAIALESRPSDFDWDLCLGGDRTRADWIACTIGLAHVLLGADVRGTPVANRAERLPFWLVPAVLKAWERPRAFDHPVPELMVESLRHPQQWPAALKSRWMSPLESTVRVGGSINRVPRLPYQVANYALQLAQFLPRLVHVFGQSSGQRDTAPRESRL